MTPIYPNIPIFDVILLAGNRPGIEPLSQNAGTSCKALVPIAGKPMLYYPLKILLEQPNVRHIWVLHQDIKAFDNDILLSKMIKDPRITIHKSGAGISGSVSALLKGQALKNQVQDNQVQDNQVQGPTLLTTGDNVLMDADIVNHFIQNANGHDVAVAMVESQSLLAKYPQSKRTWLKFRGGKYSGANLFWLGNHDKVLPILEFWQAIEQDRKKGLKIIGAFGLPLMIASLLRLITLPHALKKAGKKFNVNAALVVMPQAEACIDVDKAEDIILTESILTKRKP